MQVITLSALLTQGWDKALCFKNLVILLLLFRGVVQLCFCLVFLAAAQKKTLEGKALEDKARESEESAKELKAKMEAQMEKHREAHHQLLTSLRTEISEKEHQIEELKE